MADPFAWHPEPELIGYRDPEQARNALGAFGGAVWDACLDYLYDDSLFMAARWHAAGNETELAVYPECLHGFTSFPAKLGRIASQRIVDFISSRIR